MTELLSVDAARARVLAAALPLPAEDVPVAGAAGRVLAEDVHAGTDVPAFDNSAMDGFALRSGPAQRTLRVVGESRAGAPAAAVVGPGDAVRISTGAALPAGADAVIMVERTAVSGDGAVRVLAATEPGQNVRRAGSDVRAGALALPSGTQIGAAEVGAAITAGRATVRCARRPRVAILVTGDELRDAGSPLGPGAIHETNGPVLRVLADAAGADVVRTERVVDTPAATQAALTAALSGTDVVVCTGGVSVGAHDHVKGAFEAAGVRERFWRVALRPGKPTWFGTGPAPGQLVFGLPGNPVSAFVTFVLFVRPALAALQGAPALPERRTFVLAEPVARNAGRDEAVRVQLVGDLATPTGPQGSHVLSSLLGADGLAIVPAGAGDLPAGTPVEVERLQGA